MLARGSLRRYDVQAQYAFVLAIVSVLPLSAAAIAAWQRYDPDLSQIVYGASSYFAPAFLGCILLSILCGALACLLGFSSAGQRRNDKPKRSWLGFFVGSAAVTFGLILLIAFYMLRLARPA